MSALAKLMPRPPALVESMNTNFSLPGLLYSSMYSWGGGKDTIQGKFRNFHALRTYEHHRLFEVHVYCCTGQKDGEK